MWLDKRVHIVLSNNFVYIGKVISVDENSLVIIDKNQRKVTLRETDIILIKELL